VITQNANVRIVIAKDVIAMGRRLAHAHLRRPIVAVVAKYLII